VPNLSRAAKRGKFEPEDTPNKGEDDPREFFGAAGAFKTATPSHGQHGGEPHMNTPCPTATSEDDEEGSENESSCSNEDHPDGNSDDNEDDNISNASIDDLSHHFESHNIGTTPKKKMQL